MMVSTRRHSNRYALQPRRRRAVASDGCADSDAASLGENIPAPGAIAAPDHDDSSLPRQGGEDNLAHQVDELIPEEMDDERIPEYDTDDDDDESGERPAIRHRTVSNVITIPQRSTRQSAL